MKRTATICLLPFLFLCCAAACGQTLRVLSVDTTRYPQMSAMIYSFDAGGEVRTAFAEGELLVTENGARRQILGIERQASTPPDDVSVTIGIETLRGEAQSGGLRLSNLSVERSLVLGLIEHLGTGTQAAITSHGGTSRVEQPFTTNLTAMRRTVTDLRSDTSNLSESSMYWLVDPVAGLLSIAKQGRGKRIAILFANMWNPYNYGGLFHGPSLGVADTCARYGITLYVVYAGEARYFDQTWTLNAAARATGGCGILVSDGSIAGPQTVGAAVNQLAAYINGMQPLRVVWRSAMNGALAAYDVGIAASADNVQGVAAYAVATAVVPRLRFEHAPISFGFVAAGDTVQRTLLVTASGADLVLQGIGSNDTRFHASLPVNVPYLLHDGEQLPITIAYAARDSALVAADITIAADRAIGELRVYGGALRFGAEPATLSIISPAPGDTLTAGEVKRVVCAGVSRDTPLRLEWSSDSGATWTAISQFSSAFAYDWTVPVTISNRCLLRARQSARLASGQLTSIPSRVTVVSSRWQRDSNVLLLNSGGMVQAYDVDRGSNRWEYQFGSATGGALYDVDSRPGWNMCAAGRGSIFSIIRDSITLFDVASIYSTRAIRRTLWDEAGNIVAVGASDGTIESHTFNGIRQQTSITVPDTGIIRDIAWNRRTGVFMVQTDSGAIVFRGQSCARLSSFRRARLATWRSDGLAIAMVRGDSLLVADPLGGRTIGGVAGMSGASTITAIDWSPDGERIAIGTASGALLLFDATTFRLIDSVRFSHAGSASVVTVTWERSGTLLAASWSDATAAVLDGPLLQQLSVATALPWTTNQLAWNPDGTILVIRPVYNDLNSKGAWATSLWNMRIEAANQSTQQSRTWTIAMPELTIADVDFGTVRVDQFDQFPLPRAHAVLRNTGTLPLTIQGLHASGTFEAQWWVVSDLPLAPGDSLGVDIEFTASTSGDIVDSLVVRIGCGTVVARLHAFVSGPLARFEEPEVRIDSARVESDGDIVVRATLLNDGNDSMTITSVNMVGAATAVASIDGLADGTVMRAGERRTVRLHVRPYTVGRSDDIVEVKIAERGTPARLPVATSAYGGHVAMQDMDASTGAMISLPMRIAPFIARSGRVAAIMRYRIFARIERQGLVLYNAVSSDAQDANWMHVTLDGEWDNSSDLLGTLKATPVKSAHTVLHVMIDSVEWFTPMGNIIPITTAGSVATIHLMPEDNAFAPAAPVATAVTPNPCRGDAELTYAMLEDAYIVIDLIGMRGERVAMIDEGWRARGSYHLPLDLNGLPSGAYFVCVHVNGRVVATPVRLLGP